MKILLTHLFIFLFASMFSQPNMKWNTHTPARMEDLVSFIPNGFRLLNSFAADLNEDSLLDQLILIADTATQKQALIILIREKNKTLKVAARNDNVTSSDITVSKGSVTVSYYTHQGGGKNTLKVIFKYSTNKKDWLLFQRVLIFTSDTPTASGGYDDITTETKTAKDFGEIRFEAFMED